MPFISHQACSARKAGQDRSKGPVHTVRTVISEAGCIYDDDIFLNLAESFKIDPHMVETTRSEIADNDICLFHKLLKDLSSLRNLQIDSEILFISGIVLESPTAFF